MKAVSELLKFRPLSYVLAGFFLFAFSACDNDEVNPNEIDTLEIEDEVIADADFDEIDDLVGVGMGFAQLSSSAAKLAGENDGRFSCAEVTFNFENKTISIDFGEGCEGPNGRIRGGKIIIIYTGWRFLPGSVVTYTLENFSIDGRLIEGTRTVENISVSLDNNPKFRVTLAGGQITFLDGSVATREVDRIRVWVRAPNPTNDEYHILKGSTARGINRRGVEYEVTIVEDLIYKRSCRAGRLFIPVSGVKQIVKGEDVVTIDFGEGECDRTITVTFNGRSETFDVSTDRSS